jgi:hypothetical protein
VASRNGHIGPSNDDSELSTNEPLPSDPVCEANTASHSPTTTKGRTKSQPPKDATYFLEGEEEERANFKIGLVGLYDAHYHDAELTELIFAMTRHDFITWCLKLGIKELRTFLGVRKGTQELLLGRACRADGLS